MRILFFALSLFILTPFLQAQGMTQIAQAQELPDAEPAIELRLTEVELLTLENIALKREKLKQNLAAVTQQYNQSFQALNAEENILREIIEERFAINLDDYNISIDSGLLMEKVKPQVKQGEE